MLRQHHAIAITLGLMFTCSSQANAHIKLLQPESFIKEDDLGGPQKGSPCGPGNTRMFIGDDVQPTPFSAASTSFQAGETITVEWDETIYHPGYFRIAFAAVPAREATTDDFPDPALSDPEACLFDRAAVQTKPHGNILADGLNMAEAKTAEGRHISVQVKLPDEPCDTCSLQVVQVMEAHPAASCFYFHCADIKIAPNGAAAGGGKSGADSGGCSAAGRSGAFDWVAWVGLALALNLRRFARRARSVGVAAGVDVCPCTKRCSTA